MIESLELENFQSHKNTRLEFEEGVNVIIGPSDSGKSSIIRILRWIMWNQPLGDAFRSNWGGDTIGRIQFSDGRLVERFKGSEDHYLLGYPLSENPDEEELIFKAFGTSVPEEIADALNMNEINMQQQMDQAFLIAETSGEVARHFNRIARIDKIDSSLRAVERWVRELNSEVKHVKQDIETQQEKIKGFEYLDRLEAEIEVLEQLESTRKNKSNTTRGIEKVLQSTEIIQDEIKRKSNLLPALSPVESILDQIEEKANKIGRYKKIKQLYKNIKIAGKQIAKHQHLVKGESFINNLLSLYNNIADKENEFNELENLIQKLINNSESISTKQKKLDELEQQWHDQAPDTCPLCDGAGTLK